MSATRLMVLGLVRSLGRAHGYQIGTELHGWGADEWANVQWGSIYHALRQLTKQGLLRSFDVERADTGQPRVEYEITEDGETEFFRLLRSTVRNPDPHNDMRGAGVVFLPALTRAEAITLLEERVAQMEDVIADLDPYLAAEDGTVELRGEAAQLPSIVAELFGMWTHETTSEITWTRGLIHRLRAGAHTMADEGEGPWAEERPPEPDAGLMAGAPPGSDPEREPASAPGSAE